MSFYVLESEGGLFGTKWAYADVLDPHNTERIGPRCPVCSEMVGGLVWVPPHRVKLSSAKPEKWADFLWGAGFELMVSERFKSVYEMEGLRGIVRFWPPAQVLRVGRAAAHHLPTTLPTYHPVEIERLGPEVDEAASGLVRRRLTCTYCHRGYAERWESIVIKLDSWSGEDIFFPRGLPGTCVVSNRFVQVVAAHRMTNVRLTPAEKCAYDERRTRFASPWYVRD